MPAGRQARPRAGGRERQSLEYHFDSSTAGHDWKTVPVIIYMFLVQNIFMRPPPD
jgi:hypothetical protein